MEAELEIMLKDLMKYKDRIQARQHALIPDIRWNGTRRKVKFLRKEQISKAANPKD